MTHGRASVGRPAITNLHQLCVDTGCSLEDLPAAMDDRDGWRERERASGHSVQSARLDDDEKNLWIYSCIKMSHRLSDFFTLNLSITLLTYLIINFAHTLCFSQVLSCMKQIWVSWTLSVKKAAPWLSLPFQKFRIDMVYFSHLPQMSNTKISQFGCYSEIHTNNSKTVGWVGWGLR